MVRIASRISRNASDSMPVHSTLSAARRPLPHQRAVVGGHRVIGGEREACGARELIERLEVANAARRIARLEPAVEVHVALARVLAVIAKGSVHAQHARPAERRADAAKEIAHRAPPHDVQRVGAEHRVHRRHRPGMLVHVEGDGGAEIGCAFEADPLGERGELTAKLRRLPAEVRQGGGEMPRVLPRPAAHLEDAAARERLGKLFAEHARRVRPELSAEALERERVKALRAPLIVVVGAECNPALKIPVIEQTIAAGAAAHAMMLAAVALGFNAMWRTRGLAYDELVKRAPGLGPTAALVGLLYPGTQT